MKFNLLVTLSPISFISILPPLRITPTLSPSHLQADTERGTKKDRESDILDDELYSTVTLHSSHGRSEIRV